MKIIHLIFHKGKTCTKGKEQSQVIMFFKIRTDINKPKKNCIPVKKKQHSVKYVLFIISCYRVKIFHIVK